MPAGAYPPKFEIDFWIFTKRPSYINKLFACSSAICYLLFTKRYELNSQNGDIISKVLDDYEEYQKIKDLVEADKEFADGEGVHFSSLEELDAYLDD